MGDQQPRSEWVLADQRKSDKSRVWFIIAFAAFAVLVIGALLFFLLPRGDDPNPSPSDPIPGTSAPGPSSSATAPPTDSAPTPPPAPDPDVETFTAQVQPRLDDAVRGLDLVTQNLDVGAQIVESLQQDASILSDTAAPRTIADEWSAAVTEYASKLADLRATYDEGTDPQTALNASVIALDQVRALVGL